MRRLEGKSVLLAGGAGGIGTATAERLVEEGARVFIGDVNETEAETIAKRLRERGGEAHGGRLDLADPASINAAFEQARKALGPITRLYCNGAITREPLMADLNALDIDLAVWERTLRVNLTGYLLCVKQALPDMIKAQSGAIVFASSGASWVPEHVRVAYGVSKAGINQLARHIAHNWGKQGIRANCIAPGFIVTPAIECLDQEIADQLLAAGRSPRVGRASDIAAMVAMLLSDDGEFINGQVYAVDGGLTIRQ